MKLITNNKTFWKTVSPLFSDKHFRSNKITLLVGGEIISEYAEVAKILNNDFNIGTAKLGVPIKAIFLFIY